MLMTFIKAMYLSLTMNLEPPSNVRNNPLNLSRA